MRYYSHHIGDFDRATRHLTRIERSVYRDLIEMYYDTQSQIPLDLQLVCRKIIARTNEEATAVEQVLNEFFTETPSGWYHDRCEAEIEAFLESATQKSAAGRASAAKKAAKRQQAVNGKSTAVEQVLNDRATDTQQDVNGKSTNQEPVTSNQEPITKEGKKPRATPATASRPEDVSVQVWADWCQLRKSKRAPVTETVLTEARSEACKAGLSVDRFFAIWCARGSQGLQADWLKPHERGSPAQTETNYARQMRERVEEATGQFAHAVAAKAPGTPKKPAPWEIAIENQQRTIAIGMGGRDLHEADDAPRS